MDTIDKICILFYYTISPAILFWLASIVHTIFFME
jgi:hypothetical protein